MSSETELPLAFERMGTNHPSNQNTFCQVDEKNCMTWTTAYKSALSQLSTPSLYGEILKLENSIKHLRRSNEELRLHERSGEEDTTWIQPVIAENEEVIKKQREQVGLVKSEISERGAKSEHGEEAIMVGDSTGNTWNGNAESIEANAERENVEGEMGNGVHL
jgi:hypothetical protein